MLLLLFPFVLLLMCLSESQSETDLSEFQAETESFSVKFLMPFWLKSMEMHSFPELRMLLMLY